jgi:hypothetical protein
MPQIPQLNGHEARVLGVLIEKALTTPDQYPLSINATVNGCNQKSNRHPVTDYIEAEVHVALQGLIVKHLVGKVVPAGSRVEKFRHNAGETLGLDEGKLSILAELSMRGPQTAGELRSRVHRMSPTPGLGDLMPRLGVLIESGFVRRLDPAPGSRAERYAQLLCPDAHPLDESPARVQVEPRPSSGAGDLEARVARLEAEVSELRTLLESLTS